MPKDDWAKARLNDKLRKMRRGRRSGEPLTTSARQRRKNKRANPRRQRHSWYQAILACKTEADLSAVARTLKGMTDHGMSQEQYDFLVRVGKQRRAQLRSTPGLKT